VCITLLDHIKPWPANEVKSKYREALELSRAGAVKPVPIKTFDVSEITQAYRFFSQKNRVGKVGIDAESEKHRSGTKSLSPLKLTVD